MDQQNFINFEYEIEQKLFFTLTDKFHIKNRNKLYFYLKCRTYCLNPKYDFNNKELIINTILNELFITKLEYKNIPISKYYSKENSLSNIIDDQEFELQKVMNSDNITFIIKQIDQYVNTELKNYRKDAYINQYRIYFALKKLNELFKIQKIEEVPDIEGFIQSDSRINKELECLRYLHLANFETDNLGSITEKDLEDYIILHLEDIEPGLKYITRQLELGEGRIDILALDKKENYVIIELKIAIDKSLIWQCMYYPDELKEMYKTNRVRMITIAPEYPDYLLKPLKKIKKIECIRYKVQLSNHKIEKMKMYKVNK